MDTEQTLIASALVTLILLIAIVVGASLKSESMTKELIKSCMTANPVLECRTLK